MIPLTSITFILIFLVTIIWIKHVKKRRLDPPGPLGFPLVGMLPFQILQMMFPSYLPKITKIQMFRQMREKYGPIWSMEMGGQRIITLATYDIVHDAFINNGSSFEGKPRNDIYDLISQKQGIFLIDGPLWKENRHMTLKVLKDLGMGRKDLENRICDEANATIEYLSNNCSKPIANTNIFIRAVLNVISRLVFNEYDNYDDPLVQKFTSDTKNFFQSEVIKKCNLYPKFFATRLARYLFNDVNEYFKSIEDIREFVFDKCDKAKSLQKDKVEPNCMFDFFWRDRYRNDPTIKDERKTKEIFHTLLDLYLAGFETTNVMLQFCTLMLGRYPEMQEDLRQELLNLTDNFKHINMNMRRDCPKMLSFIDEVHRFCVLLPTLFYRPMMKCSFYKFTFNPDDIVFGDWGTISRDKTIFANPDTFNPYRFMDDSRTTYISDKHMIPFGLGRRVCIGESMANMQLFLILSRLILTFRVSLTTKTMKNFDAIVEGSEGLTYGPLFHEIKLEKV